ncbi:hypothetical protein H480_39070 [Amycolatopsis vancoresmycina DSM 44592]|uniref:Serine peptidase n=1 Tax=Amycolatopsis vancoresmycina DSM 44592 TaxID=1292037 RepID=R1HHI8_9PSEU|nr:hypothetical protein H480_39070 [Amycolatopsis vancoresmycina DSM 44592]
MLAVHGIGNLRRSVEPDRAAAELAEDWQPRLDAGYRAAGLDVGAPRLAVAYYAHLLADVDVQAVHGSELGSLTPGERAVVRAWLLAAGAPEPEEAQGWLTAPLRQAFDWLARRRGRSFDVLARIAVALARDANSYLTKPGRRRAAREIVAAAIEQHHPRVLVAHSLGSVVAYEALHAYPQLKVDLFVTVGSPLGLPFAIFDALEPEPAEGRGTRPVGVGKWVDLADPGDLVAVPKRLGDRFPVDRHEQCAIGMLDFHTLGAYLAHDRTALTIAAPHD